MQFPAGLLRKNRDAEGIERQLEEMAVQQEGFVFRRRMTKPHYSMSSALCSAYSGRPFSLRVSSGPLASANTHTQSSLVSAHHLDGFPKPQEEG